MRGPEQPGSRTTSRGPSPRAGRPPISLVEEKQPMGRFRARLKPEPLGSHRGRKGSQLTYTGGTGWTVTKIPGRHISSRDRFLGVERWATTNPAPLEHGVPAPPPMATEEPRTGCTFRFSRLSPSASPPQWSHLC